MKKKRKGTFSTILLILLLIVGLSVMLYPIVSNWWNERVQSRAIATYDEAVSKLSESDYAKIFAEAKTYNNRLYSINSPLLNYESISGYNETLNVSGNGVIGYITIPQIQVQLAIYHGTSEEVLNVAVGHLQGTSLPVGGENTHSVISAHRGLPSAKLFSDLDELVVGDEFTITILNEIFTYEVEEIFIVKPDEFDYLEIVPGKEYVTLMTCTPYGVNSHRMLVRAHRIDTVYPNNIKVAADAVQIDPMIVFPVICAPLLVVLIIFWVFGGKKNKREKMISQMGIDRIFKNDKI